MKFQCLILENLDGGVTLITLNRPHRLNALSRQLQEELIGVLDQIENDDDVHAIILTGAPRADGRPAFCPGADLKEEADGSQVPASQLPDRAMTALVEASHDHHLVATFCRRLETLGKPSIAAVDGVCTAGGLEIALACDVRVVSQTAQVSDLHIRNLGSLGGAGVTARLPRTVGQAWAKEIMFSGDTFDGDQAVQMGFANHSYAPGELLTEAISLARKFAGMSQKAVALAKAIMDQSLDMNLEQALRYSYIGTATLVTEGGEWSRRQSDIQDL